MITIVTGKINEGKTTALKALYQEQKQGDGFVSIKKMDGNKVHSFTATRLATEEHKLLLLHENYFSESFVIAGKVGPYLINLFTLSWIEKTIEQLIENRIEPIYLDEIGAFELRGYGYDRIFRLMIESNLDLIISTRIDSLEQVVEHYELKNVKVIQV